MPPHACIRFILKAELNANLRKPENLKNLKNLKIENLRNNS